MLKHVIHFLFSIFFIKICCDVYFEKVNSLDKAVSMMLFCFMLSFYVGQQSVFLFNERRKIFIETETFFEYYNGSKMHELLHISQRSKKV